MKTSFSLEIERKINVYFTRAVLNSSKYTHSSYVTNID